MYPTYFAGPIAGLRGYTDPISNSVSNTAANPLLVKNDLAAGRLSPRLLSVVLHETTHFSSFITPVGYSLAALFAAHTANPVGRIQDQDELKGPSTIAVRAELASIYLTPLLEGLALFAEFDALPGNSPVTSIVSSVALRLFCREEYLALAGEGKPISPYDFLGRFFATQRATPDFAQRKIELLRMSLISDDGYLLGYLWVKALWRVLIGRCRKLMDTDLFLSFMISYFFDDYKFATLLFSFTDAMKTSHSVDEYADAFEYYLFGVRLEDLVENVDLYVDQYEKYATQFSPGSLTASGEIENRPAYHNYSAEAAMSIEMGLAFGSIRSMHFMWPKLLAARHILRLFSRPAKVEIDEGGRFIATCEDGSKIEGAALEVARPVSREHIAGDGSIEAVFLTNKARIVNCIFLGHELIATIDVLSGEFNDDEAAESCDNLSSFLALEAASVQIADEVYFREGSKAHELAARVRERAKSKRDEFYSNLGLGTDAGTPPSTAVLSAAKEGGIARILQDYPLHTEWLARLSLSSGGKPTTSEEASDHWDIPASDIVHWLEKINGSISDRCQKEAFATDGRTFGLCQF